MGAAYRDKLAAAAGEAAVGSVMRFGVSTVRPSEDAAALAHRMGDAGVTRVVVTRPDGTLIGLFFAAEADLCRQPIPVLSVRNVPSFPYLCPAPMLAHADERAWHPRALGRRSRGGATEGN